MAGRTHTALALLIAIVVHAGALSIDLPTVPKAKPLADRVDVSVIITDSDSAPEHASSPPAPLSVPADPVKNKRHAASSPRRRKTPRGPVEPSATRRERARSARSETLRGDVRAKVERATDGLLLTLGTASGRTRFSDEAGGERRPFSPPEPLENYARAQVEYPPEAIDALAAGEVVLELGIDESGTVAEVRVIRRTGYGFDELAAELAKKYAFRPGRDGSDAPVPTRIHWRMKFAKWRPTYGGLQPAPSGAVAESNNLESSVNAEDSRAAGPGDSLLKASRSPSVPPTEKMEPLSRAEVELRPIASLSERERNELCRWQIAIRGGAQPHKCNAVQTREEVLANVAGGRLDANEGRWVVEGHTGWLGTPVSNRRRLRGSQDEIMVFVKPQDECVEETRSLDRCGITVGQYIACMVHLAERPCDWKQIPECTIISRRCE